MRKPLPAPVAIRCRLRDVKIAVRCPPAGGAPSDRTAPTDTGATNPYELAISASAVNRRACEAVVMLFGMLCNELLTQTPATADVRPGAYAALCVSAGHELDRKA